jgi:hypothetical protein
MHIQRVGLDISIVGVLAVLIKSGIGWIYQFWRQVASQAVT